MRGAALAALLAAAGCSVAPHFEHPEFALVGVEVKDASLAEQHLRVRLKVTNPNDLALPVRGIDYTLKLGGEDFGAGSSAGAFTVPARGEAEFDVLMTTHLATTLFRILPRLRDSTQPLDYRLEGTVTTGLPFLHAIPFDEKGSLPLR